MGGFEFRAGRTRNFLPEYPIDRAKLPGLRARAVIGAVLAATVATGMVSAPAPVTAKPEKRPLIVGHRGASGYRPEHTIASYELAAAMGADYIEPDLVSTKDGQLVVRHENEISGTTDVANRPTFAKRKTSKVVDGKRLSGWFTEDFTLAELRTLRAKERLPDIRKRNTAYDGRYQIPTFAEVLAARARLSKKLGRTVGIIPEIKHPTYFKKLKLPMEDKVLAHLRQAGLNRPGAPVVIQSFEVTNLIYLSKRTKVRLAQLTEATGKPYDFVVSGDKRTYADIVSAKGLRDVAKYAKFLGPEKNQIIPRDKANKLTKPTAIVTDAHRAGLLVTPYTFRNENSFLPADFQVGKDPADYGNMFAEYRRFFATGIDGLFSDNPDTAVEARESVFGGQSG